MLKRVLLALAVLGIGVAAVVASRPSSYRVERSITIAAPVEIPFALVNDFHRWRFWSPWEALDPKMRKGFDGAYAGPGAIYTWAGNKQAGKGRMTLLEAQPYDFIHIQLEFIEPWPATNALAFTFQPAPGGVTLSWAMDGHLTFMGKAGSLFVDMDARVGQDFEKGLANLKAVSETEAKNRIERDALIRARDEAARAAQPAPPPP